MNLNSLTSISNTVVLPTESRGAGARGEKGSMPTNPRGHVVKGRDAVSSLQELRNDVGEGDGESQWSVTNR